MKPTWRWRNDPATRKYLKFKKRQKKPETMTDPELAEAVTYIIGLDNPYAMMIAQHAGNIIPYTVAVNVQDKEAAMEILRNSAESLGIKIA